MYNAKKHSKEVKHETTFIQSTTCPSQIIPTDGRTHTAGCRSRALYFQIRICQLRGREKHTKYRTGHITVRASRPRFSIRIHPVIKIHAGASKAIADRHGGQFIHDRHRIQPEHSRHAGQLQISKRQRPPTDRHICGKSSI